MNLNPAPSKTAKERAPANSKAASLPIQPAHIYLTFFPNTMRVVFTDHRQHFALCAIAARQKTARVEIESIRQLFLGCIGSGIHANSVNATAIRVTCHVG